MNDADIIRDIDALVAEEHQLERDHLVNGLSGDDRARLAAIEKRLDQCWDLLRQRRARREAGQDPDRAESRSTEVVDGYQQ